jgi:DNA-binding transcriptional LysR family regulator
VQGHLVVAAPILFGRLHLVPLVAEFLELHPAVDIQCRLGDRNVNLIEEHVDVALRIGALPDSSLVALPVGAVTRVVCASPGYLARFGLPASPADLQGHRCITFEAADASGAWTFRPQDGTKVQARVHSRLTVTTADAAIAACELGLGLTRVLSYQVAEALRAGRLVRLLAAYEPPPVPVSLVHPGQGRLPLKTRAFLDFAAGRLREHLRDQPPQERAAHG